jgi:Family of unknown function (DUF5681)
MQKEASHGSDDPEISAQTQTAVGTMPQPVNTGRKQAGRFQKGKSGNPAGKPRGARHRTTVLAEKLMANDITAIVQQVIASAKGGDTAAARMVLDRIVPPTRSRPVQFKLPTLTTAADLVAALGAILAAVAAGELTPDEGASVAVLIESKRKAIEIVDLETRVSALEKQKEAPRGHQAAH